MDPILDKARAAQNALERLMNSVPGFKGYRERDLRRDADRLQREHISARLEDAKKALNQVAAVACALLFMNRRLDRGETPIGQLL